MTRRSFLAALGCAPAIVVVPLRPAETLPVPAAQPSAMFPGGFYGTTYLIPDGTYTASTMGSANATRVTWTFKS